MTQAVLSRPLGESDLRHELRLGPLHLMHLIGGDAVGHSMEDYVRDFSLIVDSLAPGAVLLIDHIR